ncbi:hypothetical protein [Gordonia liuliyuniae]|uniref:Uncharacterized protein n=1 Tax=Gordonia liuliyuniae TaxID=2911517 RepID=A0ABS9ITB2_9ACTN|nr:hypothetical protein [Gordonia liuliyuniae]MCF8588783.1 hypothetical protein [Gordonia liuliyuniae]
MGDSQAFREAQRRRLAPLAVAVGGHRGVGSSTVAAALRARFRLSCTVIGDADSFDVDPPGEADLLVRVIGAAPRRCDVRACATAAPLIVVAGKADVRDDARAAAFAAEGALGRQVLPVSALLASATVGPADLDSLLSREPADDLLRRYGLYGVGLARARLAAEPGMTADALAASLHAASGIDAVADAIRAASTAVARRRDARLCTDLRLLAARDSSREESERALVGARP